MNHSANTYILKNSRKILLSLLISLTFCITPATTKSAIIVSDTTGNWGDGSTWVGGVVPTSTDGVIVLSGHTVNLSNILTTINNLTIDSNGVLDDNNKKLTINGSFTINGYYSGKRDITFTGGSGTSIGGIGTINISNPVKGLKIYGNTTFLPGTDLVVSHKVELANGITVTNHGTVTINNNLIGKNAYSKWVNSTNSTLRVSGTVLATGVLNASAIGNTVVYLKSGTQNIKTPASFSYHHLIISGSGAKTIAANLNINGDLTISSVLNSANYNISLAGNWINTNTFSEGTGTVTFNGSNAQSITCTSNEIFYNLVVNKTSDTLMTNNNVTISNSLTMTAGIIKADTFIITLGTNSINPGTLSHTNGRVIGSFERWITTTGISYVFPIGTHDYYRPVKITFDSISTNGSVLAKFTYSLPGNNGLPLLDGRIVINNSFRDGYWDLSTANGFSSNSLNLELTGNGFTDFVIDSNTRILTRPNSNSNWIVNGTHVSASGNIAKRSGIKTTSVQFAFGDDTDCSLIAIWDGSNSTNWNDAQNWSTGAVPGRCTDIIISSSPTNQPIINDTVSSNNITINSNAKLTINSGKRLNLDGILTIKSDSIGYGSFIDYGTLSTNSNSKIERYFWATPAPYEYHYFTSPISNASKSLLNGAKALYGFDEANYQWVSLPDTLVVGTGYIANYEHDATLSFEGALNTGTQTLNVTCTDGPYTIVDEGWNLVGNPYPSTIDWNASSGWTKTNIDNTVYYRAGDQYASYNATTMTGTNGGTRYIPQTTGFFIKVNNYSGGTFQMTNDVRVHGSQSYYKPEQLDKILKIKAEANGFSDEIAVLFRNSSTMEHDGKYDAFKFFGSQNKRPEIYSLTPNVTLLSINTMPFGTESMVVPLGLWIGVSSEITFKGEDYNSFVGIMDIFLEDLQEDKLIDFRKDNEYQFYANKGYSNNRFLIHFLPIVSSKVTYDNNLTPDASQSVVSVNGINDIDNSVTIYSYEKNIYVKMNDEFSYHTVQVYDISGKEILNKKLRGSIVEKITINSTGTYIVKILGETNFYSKKVFIN